MCRSRRRAHTPPQGTPVKSPFGAAARRRTQPSQTAGSTTSGARTTHEPDSEEEEEEQHQLLLIDDPRYSFPIVLPQFFTLTASHVISFRRRAGGTKSVAQVEGDLRYCHVPTSFHTPLRISLMALPLTDSMTLFAMRICPFAIFLSILLADEIGGHVVLCWTVGKTTNLEANFPLNSY